MSEHPEPAAPEARPDPGAPGAAEAPGRRLLRRALTNPVAHKDLLVFARTPGGAGGLRVLGVALGLSIPLLVFAACVASFPGPWRFAGRPVLLVVAGLMALFNFSVAVPAATAFALERDRDTLESLIVSPLGPWQLVLGKLGAALAIGLFAKAAMLPALAIAWTLGGADLAFIPAYLVVLLAADCSFASFALLVGARRLEAPTRVGWLRTQTSQAQLALQSSVGLAVLASLVPVYAALFLVPVAFQQGLELARLLDDLAPLGALHPLAALILWGDARVLGVEAPVWLLAAAFHLVLALPMLADAVEAQRAEGLPPGRAPRLLALLPLGALLVLAAAVSAALPPVAGTLLAILLPATLLFAGVSRTAFVHPAPRERVSLPRLLGGLLPHHALESAPDRAPGYALLLTLVGAPLVLWAGGGVTGPTVATLGALALAGVSLGALGARLVARTQRREDAAFVEAAARSGAAPDDGAEREDRDDPARRPRARILLRLAFLCLLLPGLAAAGLSLGEGSVPALAGLRPLFVGLGSLGLALNPFAATLPALADPATLGTDAPLRLLAAAGVEPWVAFALHLGVYGALLIGALVSLPAPLDLDRAVAEAVGARGGRLAEPSPASPAEPAPSPAESAPSPAESAPSPTESPASPEASPAPEAAPEESESG